METTHPAHPHATEPSRTAEASARGPHESFSHFLARETKFAMRWAILIFGMATVLSMIVFFPIAIVPAVLLLVAFIVLMIAHVVERRTMQPGDPHDETAEDQQRFRHQTVAVRPDPDVARQQRIQEAVERKSRRTVVGIIVCIAVAAMVIAVLVFGRQFELLMIGGFILFAYMLLVATPVWLGWLNDEAEFETHRLEGDEGSPAYGDRKDRSAA